MPQITPIQMTHGWPVFSVLVFSVFVLFQASFDGGEERGHRYESELTRLFQDRRPLVSSKENVCWRGSAIFEFIPKTLAHEPFEQASKAPAFASLGLNSVGWCLQSPTSLQNTDCWSETWDLAQKAEALCPVSQPLLFFSSSSPLFDWKNEWRKLLSWRDFQDQMTASLRTESTFC